MSARFYVNLPLTPGPFTLDGAEAHHLATVCRLRPGAEVCLFNGDGCEYPARVIEAARREITLEIVGVEQPARELAFRLEVAAPLPKGERSQFLIEKLTELGVTAFVPLSCERSVIHPREGKQAKLDRYVIEASKQCGRNVLMEIGPPTEWAKYAIAGNPGELHLLAHPYVAEDSAELARRVKDRQTPIRVAVGPEGGFTDDEVALAKSHGWLAVGLGPRILRVETAAIVLAALVAGRASDG